jgi:hypothetical protein
LIPTVLVAGLTENMESILAPIQSIKRDYIEAKMQLTSEEKEKFWPVYDKYQEALRDLNEAYVLFVWANMEDTIISSNDKAQTIIKEFLDIETKRIELINTFAGQFGEVLPPRKLIRYLQLESRARTFMNNKVEEIIPLLE